ncbi:DUF1853 family protein [Paraburkholderia sp. D15]|uniref:DUF1853 family protein n=1 Tax=Paraburkholderia sp. D15 TaxID=2880218 RepID=UPI002478A39B|nr:DUF1853 family protein [Paraburkholderia sp. D15]WGS51822.1 DUF1853 family protein [Paraburkholderia sp. D15]
MLKDVLNDLLNDLRVTAVRDLAWLLLSPDLLRPQPPAGALATPFATPDEFDATVAWLRALDAAPQPLLQHLAAIRMSRVGRYAERLLGWFLEQGPAARLIAAGVQLRRDGITLGECDFLLQTRQGVRLHWELAMKCYLHAGAGRGQLADFVGPNLKDRLDLKRAHLLNHQLPISARDEFASTGYAGSWIPQMFVKGWLFYRHAQTPPECAELDPAHGRGWWVTSSEWLDFARTHASWWRPLPRLEWLAPRRIEQRVEQGIEQQTDADGDRTVVDAETLAGQITLLRGPVTVVALADDAAGDLVERSRGFIVPDDWPEQAQRHARL